MAMKRLEKAISWLERDSQIFWQHTAACHHVVHFYDREEDFLDFLYGFVIGGVRSGESVVVIATRSHLNEIDERLASDGFDSFYLNVRNQYIAVEANEALSKFMLNGWPDRALFVEFVSGLLSRAKEQDRKVRAFGEMVAILWSKGFGSATIQLEQLWSEVCSKEELSLLCAYPSQQFNNDDQNFLPFVCPKHSLVISSSSATETIRYTTSDRIHP